MLEEAGDTTTEEANKLNLSNTRDVTFVTL